jgi:hypothetical protein
MSTLPDGYPQEAFAAFDVLKSRKQLTIDDMKVLALIECFGEAFYYVLAANVQNPQARALLCRNGQEERGHAHRVLKAIRLKSGQEYKLPQNDENPFFRFLPTELSCDANIIASLEAGEADGDLTYQAWADNEPDAMVANLLRQNGLEETRHGQRATQVRNLLQLTAA